MKDREREREKKRERERERIAADGQRDDEGRLLTRNEKLTPPRAASYVLSGYLHARIRGSDTPTRIMHVVTESEKGGPERSEEKEGANG